MKLTCPLRRLINFFLLVADPAMLCGEKAVIWEVQLGSAAADYVARYLEGALKYDVGPPGWRLSTIGCRVDLLVNGSDGAWWLVRRASRPRNVAGETESECVCHWA